MSDGKSTRTRGRSRTALAWLGGSLGILVTFAAATVGGVALHANLPATRRLVASQVGELLAGSFRGKLALERLGRLGLGGAEGLRLRVLDPDGRQVLFVDGATLRISFLDAARSALLGDGDITAVISDLHIDYADASLDADESGTLRIQRAFEPTDTTPSDPNARGLDLTIARARIEHAWVHGQMKDAPLLDADLDRQVGRVVVQTSEMRIDVDESHIATRAAPRGADLQGRGEAHIGLPSPSGADLGLAASFVGVVGSIPLAVQAALDGEQVDVVADVAAAPAAQIRALVPEAPVYQDVALHAEAHGDFAQLAVSADATVGAGTAALEGDVSFGDETRARAAVWVRDIDVRAFSETAPASALGANLEASLVAPPGGGVRGQFDLDVTPGEIAGQQVPAAAIRGTFTEASVRGEAHIAEPGAPVRASFDVHPEGGSTVADVDASLLALRLDAVPRVGAVAHGRADLFVTGKLDLDSQRIDAHVRADAASVSRGAERADHAMLDARVRGTLTAPVIDAAVDAQDVVAGGILFNRVKATATGPVTDLAVTATVEAADGSRGEARAIIRAGSVTTIREARVSIARGGETAVATVDTIRIATGKTDVEDATLEGLGQPVHATAHVTPAEMTVRADSKDLDLARVTRLVRIDGLAATGNVAFDVDVAVRGKQANGSVVLDLTGGSFKNVRGDAHVDAKLAGRRVSGNVAVTVPGVGHAFVNTGAAELGGDVLDSASWATAYGRAKIDVEVDLARAAAALPAGTLPVGELRGQLAVKGEIGRDDAREAPEFELSARTVGLSMSAKPEPTSRVDGTTVVRPPAWRWVGVDAKTGQAHVQARALDAHGLVVALDTTATLPYEELVEHPGAALTRLESVPFDAKIWIPKRALDQLPAMLGTKGMLGSVELSASVAGTALEPRFALVARTTRIKAPGSSVAVATDSEINAKYDGVTADVRLAVSAREGNVLDATAHVNVKAKDVFDPPPGGLPWDASGLVQLTRFPLQSVTRIADMRVRGHISGEVGLADLHKDARAQANLRIDDLRVGTASYTGGFVKAKLDGEGLDAAVRLEQSDGYAETKAKLGTRWGKELAPKMDDDKAAELTLQARGFRAAAMLPFVEGTFSELDGRIDADARIELGSRKQRLAMSGTAKLTKGVFEVPAMGEEFTDAKATVVLSPDGLLRVQDISAHGVTGRIMASAVARLDGLGLSGARASVRIPKGQPIPLSVEGEGLGELSGAIDIDAKVTPDKKTVNVVVDIPTLLAQVPEVQGHTLQALEADQTVRIGVHRARTELTLVPLGPPVQPSRPSDAIRWNVQLRLGKSVEVRRGTGMRVQLEGSPTLTLNDGAKMTGQIRIRGGFLDVQGKKFEIEKGTITFVGDADNPILVVTAGWTAPDGTQVYADYVGPLKTGKVSLRSEPSLPRNEILSLILFGTQGGNQSPPPGQGPSGTTRAVGVGGGVATQGLNKAMTDVTGLDVTARVDTTDSSNPRPELEFQIAKNISLQISYVLGVPPPGENPDKSLLTLDWRFYRNLSLETTVGDRGSSIFDLIWRKRY